MCTQPIQSFRYFCAGTGEQKHEEPDFLVLTFWEGDADEHAGKHWRSHPVLNALRQGVRAGVEPG